MTFVESILQYRYSQYNFAVQVLPLTIGLAMKNTSKFNSVALLGVNPLIIIIDQLIWWLKAQLSLSVNYLQPRSWDHYNNITLCCFLTAKTNELCAFS